MVNLFEELHKGKAYALPKCRFSHDGYCIKTFEPCNTVIVDDDNNNNAVCDLVGYEREEN